MVIMHKQRESNYDLLRILSCISVIVIHVSCSYTAAITDVEVFGQCYTEHMLVSCACNAMSRFAVPCFVMLSGAFALADERNAEYKYFYKKTFKKIGIPALIFSVLYFFYSCALAVAAVLIKGKNLKRLLVPFKALIKGSPFAHMWFLYMLLGLYILTPLIIRFRKSITKSTFNRIACIISGLVVESVIAWLRYKQALGGAGQRLEIQTG